MPRILAKMITPINMNSLRLSFSIAEVPTFKFDDDVLGFICSIILVIYRLNNTWLIA
jgi:hypothetical protein